MGRAGRGEPQSLSLHSLEQPHTQTLVSGKPVTVTMRCNVDCSTIAPVTKKQEQQKTPDFPSCALAENHSLPQCFSTLQEFCTNHRNQRGESFIQTPPATAVFYLAFFEECMESSQQVLPSRRARDCQSRQLLRSALTVSI